MTALLLAVASFAAAAEPAPVPPLPDLVAMAERDSRDPAMLALWGKSVNFDEHAQAVIVDSATLSALFAAAKVAPGHAGVTHTYGYLTSTLVTPYGYKRDRWTSGVIEKGFGLPAGFLSPAPSTGTLLSNVTAFAGSIAFRDDPKELAAATRGRAPFPGMRPARLIETVGSVSIRTDFVPYLHGDGALLVYSWRDLKAKRTYLITAFPVEAKFAAALFDPGELGKNKKILVRYNGDIPLTASTGTRAVQ
ncbi:MAG: hypothetical protein HY079_08580 [Elusimicrobia bacterium]|nr:hypothetical protein [Elusimicrobiota bacterium]